MCAQGIRFPHFQTHNRAAVYHFFLILDLFGNRCSSSSDGKGELSFPSLQHLIRMKNNLTDAKVDDVSVSKEGREKSPEKCIRGIR